MAPSLECGSLEMASKQRIFMGFGDHSAPYNIERAPGDRGHFGSSVPNGGPREAFTDIPRCIVHLETGTIIVHHGGGVQQLGRHPQGAVDCCADGRRRV